MTDNTNIIKEALEAGLQTLKEDLGILSTRLAEEAPALSIRLDKINKALALIEKSEVMYECPNLDPKIPDARIMGPINAGSTIGKFLVIPLEQEQSE